MVISVCILLVRYALNGALKALTSLLGSRVEWDKTKLYYILRKVGWGQEGEGAGVGADVVHKTLTLLLGSRVEWD